MLISRGLAHGVAPSVIALAVTAFAVGPALASEEAVHVFQGGSDGSVPRAGLISDGAGNLYGTTIAGGGGTDCDDENFGCGTVYEIPSRGKESVLYAFAGGCDGAAPVGGLLIGSQGTIYGTTESGGTCNSNRGTGTVFKLAAGVETVLYAFQGTSDGNSPSGNLASDANGDLFGATGAGGNMSDCGGFGCGTVFEVTPAGQESVLYAFQGGTDGWLPDGGVISDSSGNLYGVTHVGGSANCETGCGTVFKVAPGGTETKLYQFQDGDDGGYPLGGLISDSSGNLYGTTLSGGSGGQGTVFKLSPDGTETVLYNFQGGNDGNDPEAGVVRDKSGNLYGTTYYGGGTACKGHGCGTVFKLTPEGKEKVLYSFKKTHGAHPAAGLLLSSDGTLYGTALNGGKYKDGVVFRLKK